MVKRPTLTSLAKAAGVSIATVDRVINRRLPVTDDTAQRVLKAAEAIGYHGTSLLKSRIAEKPVRRFGFLLQKKYSFYEDFGHELVSATKDSRDIKGKPTLEFMEDLAPEFIAERIVAVGAKVDALAVVTIDHPTVIEAIEAQVAQGKSVFTLLSPLSSNSATGHLGLDSRKCGRIAGWAISRMVRDRGHIGILVGSHRYINQEISEISFRAYMREHAPHLQLLEPIVNLEDGRISYEAVQDMLARYPDLRAVYVAGGGQDGLITALNELSGRQRPIVVCNEVTPETRTALLNGIVDLVLGTPIATLATLTVANMVAACQDRRISPQQNFVTPDVFLSENL
jgi:LacI family transcriptional regulator